VASSNGTLAQGSVLKGLGVGLNAVVAEVFRVAPMQALPARAKSTKSVDEERESLRSAIGAVGAHLDALGAKVGSTSAEIFEALKFLLEDDELFEVAEGHLSEGWTAAAAYAMSVDEFAELLGGDPDFDERVKDLQDLSKRVQAEIAGIKVNLELPIEGSYVIVGEDFSPADTAQFTPAVVGVITISGGPTSHTAIICRSRSIAAVVSCADAVDLVDGDVVLVDPVGDRVVVGGEISSATQAITFIETGREPIIPVRSNIGSLEDANKASAASANGVGLFRTELLYLSATSQPDVASQSASYAEILAAAPEGPIVVRTIDAGSDKPVPFLHMPHEENPSLGVRGFRLIREHRGFIEDQLHSIEFARAHTNREVWVMAPMIATASEAREFADLARSIGKFKVGIMVETPSIVTQIADLKGQIDFLSVGTNDLSQYLFAADRMNPALGLLLNPWQPALIRTLARIASEAEAAGISSGVCGESASDPAFAVVLAGLGFKSVSASASQVGAVRSALSATSENDAKRIAAGALEFSTAEEAKAFVTAELSKLN
jgi:phosphotransferase system enzyme I (PtsI)